MKKLVSVLLSLFLFAGLTACSSRKNDVPTEYNGIPLEEAASKETTLPPTEGIYGTGNTDASLIEGDASTTSFEDSTSVYFIEGNPNGGMDFKIQQYNLNSGEWKTVYSHKPLSYNGGLFLRYNYFVVGKPFIPAVSFVADPRFSPSFLISKLFDSKVSNFATYYQNDDGSIVAGYVDSTGRFVNVSEKVHPSSNSFSAVTTDDESVAFTSNNELFFFSAPEQKCYYYDIENERIVKTIDFTCKPGDKGRIVLDNQDNPTLEGNDWKGKNSEVSYSINGMIDYLSSPNGDIVFGIKHESGLENYIYQYGPGLIKYRECLKLDLGNPITSKSDYFITNIACNDDCIFFTAKKGNTESLFKMEYDFETETASEPELVCELPNSLYFRLAFCR